MRVDGMNRILRKVMHHNALNVVVLHSNPLQLIRDRGITVNN